MRSSIERIAEKATRIAQEALEEARKNVRKEHAKEYEEDLHTAYAEAVAEWYRGYIPYKYNRTGKLYTLLQTEVDAEGYVSWEISEDLNYPSWKPGPWDPFDQIVERGLHGGWVGSHSPAYSTPFPGVFEATANELQYDRLLSVKNEFYKVFWDKYS